MEIKRNISFFVDKEKDSKTKDGYKSDGKLRFRIRYSLGKIDFNVGYRVDFEAAIFIGTNISEHIT